jgi:hypothetical protein
MVKQIPRGKEKIFRGFLQKINDFRVRGARIIHPKTVETAPSLQPVVRVVLGTIRVHG